MHRIIRVVAPAVLALAAATSLAQAQQPQQQPAQGAPRMERGQRQPPSPDTIARLQEGRIAMIKAALKMSDAQQKLWEPVETQLRARQAARAKLMQDRILARQQNAQQLSPTARLERRTASETQRAEQDKAFLAAFKPFFASLADDQKPVAERLINDGHRGMHHGRGFAGYGPRHGMGGRTL